MAISARCFSAGRSSPCLADSSKEYPTSGVRLQPVDLGTPACSPASIRCRCASATACASASATSLFLRIKAQLRTWTLPTARLRGLPKFRRQLIPAVDVRGSSCPLSDFPHESLHGMLKAFFDGMCRCRTIYRRKNKRIIRPPPRPMRCSSATRWIRCRACRTSATISLR